MDFFFAAEVCCFVDEVVAIHGNICWCKVVGIWMGWEVQEMCSLSVHNVHNKVGSSVHDSFSLPESELILKEITSSPSFTEITAS